MRSASRSRPSSQAPWRAIALTLPGRPPTTSDSGSRPSGAKATVQPTASVASAIRRRTPPRRSAGGAPASGRSSRPRISLMSLPRSSTGASRIARPRPPGRPPPRSAASTAPLGPATIDAPAPAALGRVLGGVGGAQEVGRAALAGAQHRDAAGDADGRVGAAQAPQDALGDLAAALGVGAVQDDRELVAADAADERVLDGSAADLLSASADRPQRGVARPRGRGGR